LQRLSPDWRYQASLDRGQAPDFEIKLSAFISLYRVSSCRALQDVTADSFQCPSLQQEQSWIFKVKRARGSSMMVKAKVIRIGERRKAKEKEIGKETRKAKEMAMEEAKKREKKARKETEETEKVKEKVKARVRKVEKESAR